MYRCELFHDLDLSRDVAIDTDICIYVRYIYRSRAKAMEQSPS
jgi:hypothetical protein